jgi:hypothetical protein
MQTRHGNRWTVNETLSLQREYELLEWTIQQIAASHQRTVRAILFKLEQEEFIPTWYDARGYDIFAVEEVSQSESTWRDVECCDEVDDEKDGDYVDECDEEDDDEYEDEDDDSEVAKLSERVWSLETSVNDIGSMVKQLFDYMLHKKSKKSKKHNSSTISSN